MSSLEARSIVEGDTHRCSTRAPGVWLLCHSPQGRYAHAVEWWDAFLSRLAVLWGGFWKWASENPLGITIFGGITVLALWECRKSLAFALNRGWRFVVNLRITTATRGLPATSLICDDTPQDTPTFRLVGLPPMPSAEPLAVWRLEYAPGFSFTGAKEWTFRLTNLADDVEARRVKVIDKKDRARFTDGAFWNRIEPCGTRTFSAVQGKGNEGVLECTVSWVEGAQVFERHVTPAFKLALPKTNSPPAPEPRPGGD